MKYLYKYPQAAFPYDDLVETSRRPEPRRVRVRTARHRRLRRGSLLRRVRRVRQGVARRHPRPDHASTTAGRNRPSSTSCRRSGSATSGPGTASAERPMLRQVAGSRDLRRSSRQSIPSWASATCTARATSRCCSPRTKRTRSASSACRTARPYVKDGINNYVVHGQHERGEPGEEGTKVAAHYRLTVPPGDSQVIRLRLTDVAPADIASGNGPQRSLRRPRSTRCLHARRKEADEFYAAVIPASLDADAGQRHAAGAGGNAVEQAVLPLRRGQVAGGARLRPVQGDAQDGAAQRPLAPHVQRRRHLDAGQVGVSLVRGLGPRLPRACR